MTTEGCFRDVLEIIKEEYRAAPIRGYKSTKYLKILDLEKGFEGYLSLLVMSYALWWQVRNAFSLWTGLLGLCLSMFGVASYLFDHIFMTIEEHSSEPRKKSERTESK